MKLNYLELAIGNLSLVYNVISNGKSENLNRFVIKCYQIENDI